MVFTFDTNGLFFLKRQRMSERSWPRRLFVLSFTGGNRRNKLSCWYKTLGSASRTIILGKSGLSAGAAPLTGNGTKLMQRSHKEWWFLDCTVWSLIRNPSPLLHLLCDLGQVTSLFTAAIHLWKWSWWCCSLLSQEFWEWKGYVQKDSKVSS